MLHFANPVRPARPDIMDSSHRLSPMRGGFTQIELLAVIAVIAVLAALIFPAVRGVLASARSSKCMTNLRTIHGVALMHSQEQDGWLITWGNNPLPGVSPMKRTRWHQGLAPMFEEAKLAFPPHLIHQAQSNPPVLKRIWNPLASPAIPSELGFGPGGAAGGTAAPGGFYITYAVSPFIGIPSDPEVERAIVKLANIEDPGKSIYLVTGWAAVAASTAANDVQDPGFPERSGNVYFPHNGRANAIFVDGHVEAFQGVIPARYFRATD